MLPNYSFISKSKNQFVYSSFFFPFTFYPLGFLTNEDIHNVNYDKETLLCLLHLGEAFHHQTILKCTKNNEVHLGSWVPILLVSRVQNNVLRFSYINYFITTCLKSLLLIFKYGDYTIYFINIFIELRLNLNQKKEIVIVKKFRYNSDVVYQSK